MSFFYFAGGIAGYFFTFIHQFQIRGIFEVNLEIITK